MESTVFYKTKKGYSYYLDMNNEVIGVLHPNFLKFVQEKQTAIANHNDISEQNYYKDKYDYLLQHNFFKKKNIEESKIHFTPEMVEDSLANTEQVVFEVTDGCNLQCVYCGYRDLYKGYDKRENKNLNISDAINIWDQINKIISEKKSIRTNEKIVIGFYGGEPLLNFNFIQNIVMHIKNTSAVDIQFNMTTNAMLLDKHMNFLIDNDFSLLISLDGDYNGNSYRLTADKKNPHSKIINNIDLLQKEAPEYFQRRVEFNAVLHDANSVYNIYNYIHTRFGKRPHISEMSTDGVTQEEEYKKMKKDFVEDFLISNHKDLIFQEYFTDFPLHKDINNVLKSFLTCSVSVFSDFLNSKKIEKLPTGTCLPFNKKVFVTVNGKLLVCEKIDHVFSLGQFNNENKLFDFCYISKKYNDYYEKIQEVCQSCYYKNICSKCVFSNAEEMKPS